MVKFINVHINDKVSYYVILYYFFFFLQHFCCRVQNIIFLIGNKPIVYLYSCSTHDS